MRSKRGFTKNFLEDFTSVRQSEMGQQLRKGAITPEPGF